MIALSYFTAVATALFVIGFVGVVVNRQNMVSLLMSIELILLACNTNFIAFSQMHNNHLGDVFVFFVLAVAAVESAIGLAILVLVYRQYQSIDVRLTDQLKG